MDRISPINSTAPAPSVKRRQRGEGRKLLLPGERQWELWSIFGKRDGTPADARRFGDFPTATEGLALLKNDAILAIPSRDALLIPLWLTGKDQNLFPNLAALQLEKRGLIAANPDGVPDAERFKIRVIQEVGDRTLVAVTLLAEPFPAALCTPPLKEYRLMPDLFPLPENQVTLWHELGQWVFCITRGAEPVFLHALPSGTSWESLVSEIHFTLLTLEAEEVLNPLVGAAIWTVPTEEEEAQWHQVLNLDLHLVLPLLPGLDGESRCPIPTQVRFERIGSLKKRKKTLLVRELLLVYFLLLAALGGDCAWLYWQTNQLRAYLIKTGPDIDDIRQTAERWTALEPALLPENYAVETLFRCTRNLPEDGLRLVSFALEGESIVLEGEAKNASLAYSYVETLKKDPDLSSYTWEILPPKLLSNNSAQFQIEGKSKYETAHTP